MLSRSTPRLALSLLVLGAAIACSESDESASKSSPRTEQPTAPAPPYLLDDTIVENVIGALTDLKEAYSRQNPPVNAQSVPASIGVGITFHVPGAEKITQAHGFVSNLMFEQALAQIQFTLPVVLMGEQRGLDGQAMRYQLDNFKQSIAQELERTRRDQSLSATARRTQELELEAQISDIDRRIEETRSVAEAMTEMSQAIPDQNVNVVRKYSEKLLELLKPNG